MRRSPQLWFGTKFGLSKREVKKLLREEGYIVAPKLGRGKDNGTKGNKMYYKTRSELRTYTNVEPHHVTDIQNTTRVIEQALASEEGRSELREFTSAFDRVGEEGSVSAIILSRRFIDEGLVAAHRQDQCGAGKPYRAVPPPPHEGLHHYHDHRQSEARAVERIPVDRHRFGHDPADAASSRSAGTS